MKKVTTKYFSFHLPIEQYVAFLVEDVQPCMQNLLQSGRITGWFFEPEELFRQGRTRRHTISLALTIPHTGRARNALEPLTPLLRKKGGRWLDSGPGDRKALEDRLGGPEGLLIHNDFQELDSELVLRLLKCLRDRPFEITDWQAGLASFFFLCHGLGIPSSRREMWLNVWLHSLSHMVPESDAWLAKLNLKAAKLEERFHSLDPWVARLQRNDWGKLGTVLRPYVAFYRKIGRRLASVKQKFQKHGKPLEFAILHSYVHIHLRRLGWPIHKESLLVTLAMRALSRSRK